MTTRRPDAGPSIDDILADIRRQAAAAPAPATAPEEPAAIAHAGLDTAASSGGASRWPQDAGGSPSLSDAAATDDDALDDYLDDLAQSSLAEAAHEYGDLPSILKSPRHCAVLRPMREPSGRRLSDALVDAGLSGAAALAHGIGRSEARIRKHFSTSSSSSSSSSALSSSPARRGERSSPTLPGQHPPVAVREAGPVASRTAAGSLPAVAQHACPSGLHALVLDAATLAQSLEGDLVRSLRNHHGAAADADRAHDGAADLLRPMLRRWIEENMPRLIEVALDRELSRSPPGGGYNRAG